jgi:ABC-2 type transport system ATP-binding protein
MDHIELKNVYKSYEKKTILKNITFNICQGSVLGMLGSNGAGKTSLIRLLTQITKPDSGTILYNGFEHSFLNLKKIGYLPEERGLYKKMKVGENAIFLAILKGMSYKEAEVQLKKWFERLEIDDWWDKKVEELSKGMQQKVQFIISVIHKPELLILDEPFSGLDPINYQILSREIQRLNQEGTTIILSTHNMNTVENLCDDIIFINFGEIVSTGSVKDIKQKYKTLSYEIIFKGYLESFKKLSHEMIEIEIMKNEAELHWITFKLKSNIPIENVLSMLLAHFKLLSFKEMLPTIEDIFVKLIKQN